MAVYPKKSREGRVIPGAFRITYSKVNPETARRFQTEENFYGTERQAKLRNAALVLEHGGAKRGQVPAPAPVSFRAPLLSDYLTTYAAEKILAKSTWRNRKYQLAMFAEKLGHLRLDEITRAKLHEFRNARKAENIGPAKCNDDMQKLVNVLIHAKEEHKLIETIPTYECYELDEERVKVWTAEEVDKLYRSFTIRRMELLPITEFLVNTGLRKGEALALTWDRVNANRRMIEVWPNKEWAPKNRRPREVPVTDTILEMLEGERTTGPWVFTNQNGARYATWPQRDWDAARQAAKIEGSPHVCRHTYASHFLMAHADLFLLSQILGHSHERTTKLYAHLLPGHLARGRGAVSLHPGAPATTEEQPDA